LRASPGIRRDPLAFLARTVAEHGPLVTLPVPRNPALLVNTVDGVRQLLVDRAGGYSKQTAQYRMLSLVTGIGLLTADGEQWRHRRRIDQPAFHRSRLELAAAATVQATERLRGRLPATGAVLDVEAAALQVSVEVVVDTLMTGPAGADGAAEAVGAQLVAAVQDALDVVMARARTPIPLPAWAPTPTGRRLRRATATLDAACAELAAQRRAAGLSFGDGDLLALLLRAADAEALTGAEVRDELVTMVIAGHETVASALTWALHLLARHPDAQARLHAELDAVLAGRPPRWADLQGLEWTSAVVEEALRLYPPAWVLTRRAEQDDELDGVPVPAGTLVIVSPWLVHRRADLFADPERFDPTRFLGEARRSVPRHGYLPFGAGPRLCIGRDLALVEAVLMLATLLRDRAVLPVPGWRLRFDAGVTLRPRAGLPLRLLPR
jgi:cytochrome P450